MFSNEMTHILILLLVAFAPFPGQQPRRTFSVCDLLIEANNLDGRIVRVHGILRDSDPKTESPYFDELAADNCTDEKHPKGPIRLISPDQHFLANPPSDYKPDLASVRKVEQIIAKLEATGEKVSGLDVTVEGVFYIQRQKPEALSKTGDAVYAGFIVIQAIRDVKPIVVRKR
jgi:hypothetical protein